MYFLRFILIPVIILCKVLFTAQRPTKIVKLYDDYGSSIMLRVPKDVISTKDNIPLHIRQKHEGDDEDPEEDVENDPPSSEYSDSSSSGYETTDSEHEGEHYSNHNHQKHRPKKRRNKAPYRASPPHPSNHRKYHSKDLYEDSLEPKHFNHLSGRMNDPNSLMVKVYRGPNQQSKSGGDFVDPEPFASFGYYIKYPKHKQK